MNDVIRIVIADDHLVVREGLRLILETGSGFEVVGEAADGWSAVQLVEQLQPDVVLMDLRMPGMDGLEAIEYIRERWTSVSVVILTTYNEDHLMIRGLRAGARGYLLKDISRETLFNAIRMAAQGGTLLQPEIMERVLSSLSSPAPSSLTTVSELSMREREVLQAVARGERSKEIASQLNISERTVKAHLASIYNKLGVDSRAAAVAMAIKRGDLPNMSEYKGHGRGGEF